MAKKTPAPLIDFPKSLKAVPGFLWRTLDLPSFIFDMLFIICVLLDIALFSKIKISYWRYSLGGNILILAVACALYFGLGYLMGQQAYAWRKRLGMSLFKYIKSGETKLSDFLIYPLGLYYLPAQIVGSLLFLPIYFDILPISGILAALISFPFGLLYGQEIAANIESETLTFDVTKDNFPEFFPAYAIIFMCVLPVEIYYKPKSWGTSDLFFWGLVGLILSYLTFKVGRLLIYRLKQFISNSAKASIFARGYSHTFNFTILLLILMIEYLLYTDMQARNYSEKLIKFLFCVFGLLPFRILTVFTPPLNILNIGAAVSALSIFILDTE